MKFQKISCLGILLCSTLSLGQVGIGTEDPKASLDIHGDLIIRDVEEVNSITQNHKILLRDTSVSGDNKVYEADLNLIQKSQSTTAYAAEKDGSWELLDLDLGNSWYNLDLDGNTNTKIGDPTIFQNGTYLVRESGIYVVNYELQFEAGVNLELLGGKSLGVMRNGVVEEQKVMDGIRVSLLGLTLASIPVTSTSLNTMLILEEGDELSFALNSGGILPIDLGLLGDSKISIYIYKIADSI